MLTIAAWVNAVREQVGVTGVSQIWDDVPAWYFWIAQGPRAYQLQMERAWRDGPDDIGCYHGLFSVRCFPYRTDPLFPAFSFYERSLLESKHFDESNTPRFESRLLIPDSLFMVGTLEIAYDVEDRWGFFTLESLDAMRATYRDEAVEEYDLIGTNRSYAAGDVARQVPGWAISFGLFDRLVALFSYHRKHGPSRVTLSQSQGFEYAFTAADGWRCVETSPANMLCMNVLFAENLDLTDGARAVLEDDTPHRNREVLFDFSLPCRCSDHGTVEYPQVWLCESALVEHRTR